MKRIKIWSAAVVVIVIAVVIIGLLAFSTGQRVGKVVKFSKKGFVFKSYEGTLQLGDQGSNLWNFTVSDDSVVAQINDAVTSQQQVLVTYKEHYWNLIPRDTDYEVTKIEPVGGAK